MTFTNNTKSEKINSWIYSIDEGNSKWLLQSVSTSARIYFLSGTGYISHRSVIDSYSVLPAFYLKPNVKIKSGDGTMDSPYEFEL